ncbi:polymorphic toxin-type HINT domain-containing protein [Streptomyces anulatus]|uniref:polymorphic toxin-type HINT domain-containing protein n=1 Tax=Streptomyces anulatus TaxID=1892 RepID=UPI00386E5C53
MALARKSAVAAGQARDAARSAAAHARASAKAANEAADQAGHAETAAAKSKAHAVVAQEAADTATVAGKQAKNIFELAREVEVAELQARTSAGIERAKDLKAEEAARATDRQRQAVLATERAAEARKLATEAARPDADPVAVARQGRSLAVLTMVDGGPWARAAAEAAVAGSDAEVISYVRGGWQEASQEDDRVQVARLSTDSPVPAVSDAAEQALAGDAAAVEAFLRTGQYVAGESQYRIHIAQLADTVDKLKAEAEEERQRLRQDTPAERMRKCGLLECPKENDPFHCDRKPPSDPFCASLGMAKVIEPYARTMFEIGLAIAGLSQIKNCLDCDLEACMDLMQDAAINNKIRLLKGAYEGLRALDNVACETCFPAGTKVLMAEHFNTLTVGTGRGGPAELTATYEHPFWSPSRGSWIDAADLRPGDTLLSDDGSQSAVQDNAAFTRHARTYNLTVDGLHTYYVLAGETPVLVHNSSCPHIALGKSATDDNPFALVEFAMEHGAEMFKH